MADLDIWIATEQSTFYTFIAPFIGKRLLIVKSLPEMIALVLANLNPGDRIRSLKISDHGQEFSEEGQPGQGRMLIGENSIDSRDMYENPSERPAFNRLVRAFAPIRDRLAPNARLELLGCRLGRADKLLISMSRVLGGIPVFAGSGYQADFVPGFDGYVRRCEAPPDKEPLCSSSDIENPFQTLAFLILREVLRGQVP